MVEKGKVKMGLGIGIKQPSNILLMMPLSAPWRTWPGSA